MYLHVIPLLYKVLPIYFYSLIGQITIKKKIVTTKLFGSFTGSRIHIILTPNLESNDPFIIQILKYCVFLLYTIFFFYTIYTIRYNMLKSLIMFNDIYMYCIKSTFNRYVIIIKVTKLLLWTHSICFNWRASYKIIFHFMFVRYNFVSSMTYKHYYNIVI